MDSAKAYQKRAGVTGTDPYQYNVPNTPEGKDKAISAMQKDLEAGKAVPLGAKHENGGGHAMLAQSYDPKKGFLISDPMSGKTAWISKDELKDGKFKDKFGIPQDRLGTVTVDKPEGRKEVDKLFDGNENLKVKPAEVAEAVKKNPEVLEHLTKTERGMVDSALKTVDADAKKPELDKLRKGIEKKDDEAVSRAINYDPSLLSHLSEEEKGKALEQLRGGSATDVHAMQHIVRSCQSKMELRNVLRQAGNKDIGQATFHKYDKEMTAHHPYLIADLLNPDNKNLPNDPPSPTPAVNHYPQHIVDTWPD